MNRTNFSLLIEIYMIFIIFFVTHEVYRMNIWKALVRLSPHIKTLPMSGLTTFPVPPCSWRERVVRLWGYPPCTLLRDMAEGLQATGRQVGRPYSAAGRRRHAHVEGTTVCHLLTLEHNCKVSWILATGCLIWRSIYQLKLTLIKENGSFSPRKWVIFHLKENG